VQSVEQHRLSTTQFAELNDLISEHRDQISWNSDDIGKAFERSRDIVLRNPTQEGAFCEQKPYRLSHEELEVFKEQIAILLAQGVITKAEGPTDFLSPVLFVPKSRQPDRPRMCMDLRRLSKVSKHDYHALPHIRDLQNDMSGSKHFTA
jgi:hypothetical protein